MSEAARAAPRLPARRPRRGMRRRTLAFMLAGAGALVLCAAAWGLLLASRRGEPPSNGLESVIADIEAGRRTTPLISEPAADGGARVTFLARRVAGRVPRIVSDVTGWGEQADGTFDFAVGAMAPVGRTDWYSLDADVAPRARIEYLIAYAPTDYRLDPHNPRHSAGPERGGAPASEFVMPGYVPPQEYADLPASPAGLLTEASMESPALGGTCRLIVHTPAGYAERGDYPLAVFLDPRSSLVARVLDWLIARQAIEPIVSVFVVPKLRGDAGWTSVQMRAFLTGELPAWMASHYGVTRSAARRAIVGISFGAKDALDAALNCSGGPVGPGTPACGAPAFERLGLLIPGRRIGRADIDAAGGRRSRRLRVAILAGRYDHANVETARGLRQALVQAGDAVDYVEVPEGHSAVTWTSHVGGVLVSLFGP
jgi:enterochelin esterase-like enzyme